MLVRCGTAIAVAVAVFLLVPATSSFAVWTNPLPLNSLNGDASSPSIGLDAAGNAVVAYREAGGGLLLNTRAADGTLGTRVPINDTPAGPPSIATNASGLSAIAWQQSDGANSRLHMRLRRANGRFSADTTVSQPSTDVQSPEVGIDDAGNAFVSWGAVIAGVPRTFVRKLAAGGSFGPITPVSPATGNNQRPHLAVEPGGRAYLTWIVYEPTGQTVWGRALSTAGVLSTPTALAGSPGALADDSVSIAGNGKALVAWQKTVSGGQAIQARTQAANGTLTAIATISGAGADLPDTASATTADVGVVAWRRVVGADTLVQSRRIVSGAWQPVDTVSPTGTNATELRVGADRTGGRVTVLFSALEEAGSVQRVRARTRNPDGTYGPADIVSSENGLAAQTPRLAVNATGQAAAAWRQQRDDQQGDLIWVGTNFL